MRLWWHGRIGIMYSNQFIHSGDSNATFGMTQPRDKLGRFLSWAPPWRSSNKIESYTREQMKESFQSGMGCGSIMSPQKQFDLFMRQYDKLQ